MQQHHKFAARALGRGIQPGGQGLGGLGGDFFKLLGQLAGQRHGPRAQHGQGLGQFADAVGGLQQHHAAGLGGQLLRNHAGAFRILHGQKTGKHKTAMFGAVGHGTGRTEGRGDAAGTGQGQGAQACGVHGRHQAGAGVAHAGGACIAHIGHPLALLQPLYHGLCGLGLVVLVHGQQLGRAFVDAVGAQQGLGMARVLAGHGVGQLQHMQRAQRDVGQIANGRGHHVQGALWIMLRSRCIACGAQG